MSKQFDKMKKYSEFLPIPGSKGYQINSYGFIFDKKGARHFTYMKLDIEFVALIIDGKAEELQVNSIIFKLFGVKYNQARKDLFNMRLAMRK